MVLSDFGLGAYDEGYDEIKIVDRFFKLPDGQYEFVVASTELVMDNFQNPRFTLNLEILDGDYRGMAVPLDNGFHDDNKRIFFKKTMIAIGHPNVRPGDVQDSDVRDSFVGIHGILEAYTSTSKQNGKTYAGNLKIVRLLPPIGGQQQQATVRQKQQAQRPANGTAQPTARQAAPVAAGNATAPIDSDDLPF